MGPQAELERLTAVLRDYLGHRRMADGLSALECAKPLLEELLPGWPGAGILLGMVAQWVDAGFADHTFLRRLTQKFARQRGALPLAEYLHLRMADGVLAMGAEDFDAAFSHFRLVQSLEDEVFDQELLAVANFWAGRCLRQEGRYDDALSFTHKGESLALACGYAEMAAIMQTSRSWLAFQRGRLAEAASILRAAEIALDQTDDFRGRGNIKSAYGRIARRQGRYELALSCFEKAISEYRRGGGQQIQLARALLNNAFVNRLMALQVQRDLDRDAASRRSGPPAVPAAAERSRSERSRVQRFRDIAREQLRESLAIFSLRENHRGIASVRIDSGLLALDSGDLETAGVEASAAFRHGEEKHDRIVMARARTLQCMVDNGRMEEGIGDPGELFVSAENHARDAIEFARQTQNRHLLARAYIWQGLTLVSGPRRDMEAARRYAEQASDLLKADEVDREYGWDDLETLRKASLVSGPVDAALQSWSIGVVGDKSFQRITEEFAQIVIPKVWEREGRKVSRVAAKLSISPKKVRRILRAAGLTGSGRAHGQRSAAS
jgi:tetratricopeptide (TPR) repeat protein